MRSFFFIVVFCALSIGCPGGNSGNGTGPEPEACEDGFAGTDCSEDIDECANATLNTCDILASCTNTEGAYTCVCPVGTAGDGENCTACTTGTFDHDEDPSTDCTPALSVQQESIFPASAAIHPMRLVLPVARPRPRNMSPPLVSVVMRRILAKRRS
jgi:hypothetical protein